jgi:CRP/FNR family transcriptional regulator, cyclic AMP receptor protein
VVGAAAKGHEDTSRSVLKSTFGCDDALADVMFALARFFDYPARSSIIEEGAESADVHLLVSGHARKQVISMEGRMIVVEDYHEGDLFGESGLTGAPTPGVAGTGNEVLAVRQSCAGAFANHEFLNLMTTHAPVALAVSRAVIARLGDATRRFAEGFTLSAAGRVHAELLRRARAGHAADGTAPGGQLTISPPPVFSEFALTVQSTRETVSRTINALEKRGIVRRSEDALTIVAPHRLEELVY